MGENIQSCLIRTLVSGRIKPSPWVPDNWYAAKLQLMLLKSWIVWNLCWSAEIKVMDGRTRITLGIFFLYLCRCSTVHATDPIIKHNHLTWRLHSRCVNCIVTSKFSMASLRTSLSRGFVLGTNKLFIHPCNIVSSPYKRRQHLW